MTPPTQQRLAVVLSGTRNPLNIGAAARAMSNFGFMDLRLGRPHDEAFRGAVSRGGASEILQKASIYNCLEDALSGCSLVAGTAGFSCRQPQLPLIRLERGARLIRRHLSSANAAILFGCEKSGLTNDDLSHCHLLIRIPTRPEHESMNLGQAVAVVLWELARQPQAARRLPGAGELADAQALERIVLLMKEAQELSGAAHIDRQKTALEKLRQLVLRAGIRQGDADIWAGLFRQLIWRLKNPERQCYPVDCDDQG